MCNKLFTEKAGNKLIKQTLLKTKGKKGLREVLSTERKKLW